jgi:hypothetical protein
MGYHLAGFDVTGPSREGDAMTDEELAAIRERAELWAIRVPDHPSDDTAAYVHVGDESTSGFIASARGDIPALLAEVDRLTRIVAANHEGANYAEELLTKQCTEVDRLRARVVELEAQREGYLRLTPRETSALDQLLDAFLATEERWEILPALRRIRLKLSAFPERKSA